jgi:hypothetical protein
LDRRAVQVSIGCLFVCLFFFAVVTFFVVVVLVRRLNGIHVATRPELRMLEQLHVDVYGMSTVPEVVAARHCGYEHIVALGVITDMCVVS